MNKFSYIKLIVTGIFIVVISCLLLIASAFLSGRSFLISQAIQTIMIPVQKAANHTGLFFSNIYKYFDNIETIHNENEELRKIIVQLNEELREAEAAIAENQALRTMLDLKKTHTSFDLEMAEVVAVSSGDWDMSFTIDKGSLSGISLYDCVICEEGMVGYISELGTTFARIATIVDPQTQVGAIVSRSRECAVLEGSYEMLFDGLIKLSYLKKEADIIVGDPVETSGVGGIFPKGILVGTVERIESESHGISNYAIIKPAVNLSNVHQVFVIKEFQIEE